MPEEKKEEIKITTMQDDLKNPAGVVSAQQPEPSAPKQPTPPPVPPKLPTEPKPADKFESPVKPPLPPVKKAKKGKKKRKSKAVLILIIILAVILIASAVALFFSFRSPTANEEPAQQPEQTSAVLIPEEAIPANAESIISYKKPTINGSQAEEMHKITLPDDPRKYTLIRKSDFDLGIFTGSDLGATAQLGDWVVGHPLDTTPYTTALSEGTLASLGQYSPDMSQDVSIYLDTPGIHNERTAMLGTPFTIGHTQAIELFGDSSSFTGTANLAGKAGNGEFLAQFADLSILSLVPNNASDVVLGSNFGQDVSSWQLLGETLDNTILSIPAVEALLASFNTPYAFYINDKSPQPNASLVIVIPPELKNSLTLGDETLEQGLQALSPMISGQKLTTAISYSEAEYAGVPLRFTNIQGSTVALDYALTDQYLLISTSKETMSALIDTVTGAKADNANTVFQELLDAWQLNPEVSNIFLSQGQTGGVLEELQKENTPFGISFSAPANDQAVVNAFVLD